jgi:protein-L-isoaspartate(D-aspartate) O-methyltransferase
MVEPLIDLNNKPIYPNPAFEQAQGVGFTSQRTRDRLIARLMHHGIQDDEVLNAMRVVPRHLFMDEALANRSYEDTALPIGYGQTISQPWVVAQMTAWVRGGRKLDKVLDIGTGSGYQAAILALLANHVFTVERIEPLQQRAKKVLDGLALNNINYHISDGHWGWSLHAPYDAIVCAAAPETLPESLLEQLKEGGRLVLPIGGLHQVLKGYEKTSTGVKETFLGEVMFVPLKTGVEA